MAGRACGMIGLQEIDRPTTSAGIRSLIVAHAESIAGWDASDRCVRQQWNELLGPVMGAWDLDRPFRAYTDASHRMRTEGVSTCALVCLGILRRIGADCPTIYQQYVPGTCMSTMQSIAAWRLPHKNKPSAGDMLIAGTGMLTHALTVIDVSDSGVVTSVDGGQIGRGNLQAIRRIMRAWQTHGPSLSGRLVHGWIDADAITFNAGHPCFAPTTWQTLPMDLG